LEKCNKIINAFADQDGHCHRVSISPTSSQNQLENDEAIKKEELAIAEIVMGEVPNVSSTDSIFVYLDLGLVHSCMIYFVLFFPSREAV